jgi:uncharacterized membrane protein
MKNLSLKFIGRIFLGLSIAGIGLIHFVVSGFRPDILPISLEATWQIFPYLMGVVLTLAGIAIIADKETQIVSLSLSLLLILILLLGHLPIQLNNQPERLGSWTPTVKLLALAGGLLILSNASDGRILPGALKKLYKISRYGKYLFAVQLIIFGIAHLAYAERLQNIVPEWLPERIFWVYGTGIALMGSGLSIFLGFRLQLISLLLAVMFFIWLVILHIPGTIKFPFGDGSLAISSLQCLAACGIALLICNLARSPKVNTCR